MSYQKYYPNGWQSGEAGGTPITPEALSHIENGILNSAPAGYVSGDYDIRNYASLDALISSIYTAMPNRSVKIVRIADNGGTVWGGGANFARFAKEDSIFGVVTFFGYNRRGSELQKCLYNGEWQPLEWNTPPMELDEEYRTTKRHNDKPVYAKAVTCGALGQNTADDVPNGISNVDAIWITGGYWRDATQKWSLPYFGGADDNQVLVSAYGGNIHRVHKGSVYNIVEMVVNLEYTKTT